MPGLLAQVSSDVVLSPPDDEPVPDTLLPRLDREVRRPRLAAPGSRWASPPPWSSLITALGAFAITGLFDDDDARRPPDRPSAAPSRHRAEPRQQAMQQVGQDVLNATVAMTSVAWGTKLDLTCSYDPPEHEYGEPPPPGPTPSSSAPGRRRRAGRHLDGAARQDPVVRRRHRRPGATTSPRSRCARPTAPPCCASPRDPPSVDEALRGRELVEAHRWRSSTLNHQCRWLRCERSEPRNPGRNVTSCGGAQWGVVMASATGRGSA